MKISTAEENEKSAEYFDKAVRAYNSALQYKDSLATEGNIRFAEGNKYTSLANAEVERAKRTSGQAKAGHLRRAAEYRLSGAQAIKQAAELRKKKDNMPLYYNRLGGYHRDRSGYHYYRAWAKEELESWEEALEEYEASKEERETAIELYRKSLRMEFSKPKESNLKISESFLKNRINDIANVRPKAEKAKRRNREKNTLGPPNIDINLKEIEGMMQNLVSTLSVELNNTGEGRATNIDISLKSAFLGGDTTGKIGSLGAGKNTSLGLSVLPTKPGTPTAELVINYKDINGNSYSQNARTRLTVAKPEEKRPAPQQIFNIQGDYVRAKHSVSYTTDDKDAAFEFAEAEKEKEHAREDTKVMMGVVTGGRKDKMTELKELIQMRKNGYIDEDEFKMMKKDLMGK